MKPFATGATLLGLFVASSAYNELIDRRLRRSHTPGATAWQVVAGTAYTLIGAVIVLGTWCGRRGAFVAAATLAATFTAAGLPMLAGDIERDL